MNAKMFFVIGMLLMLTGCVVTPMPGGCGGQVYGAIPPISLGVSVENYQSVNYSRPMPHYYGNSREYHDSYGRGRCDNYGCSYDRSYRGHGQSYDRGCNNYGRSYGYGYGYGYGGSVDRPFPSLPTRPRPRHYGCR